MRKFLCFEHQIEYKLCRLRSNQVDCSIGLIYDKFVKAKGINNKTLYSENLQKKIKYHDAETKANILSNNFAFSLETASALYKFRWQIKFLLNGSSNTFESIFFGISENSVKSQIWIVVSVYVHIAIIRKRLH